ncbi:MAG: alpha/beta fold hydrolase [Candidatus Woesearchaeota archaeon]
MSEAISFKNNKGQVLKGFVHVPRKKADIGVLILHGFPGCMCSGRKRLAGALTAKGLYAMRFDFSGSHQSQGKFEDKLMSQEVKEVKYAIDYFMKNYPIKKLVLHGHSTGAIDAALYAHKDKRIWKLVLAGVVSHLNEAVRYDFTDEQMRDFWLKGHIVYRRKNKWYNMKRLKKAFYDEFFTLSIPKAMKRYNRPLLIIHGTEDMIPVKKDPIELHKLSNKPKKLVLIKGADHGFKKREHFRKYVGEIVRFVR